MTLRFSWHECRVDGHLVRYQVAGEGEPVVLVHGLAATRLCWYPVAPALARSCRIFLVDLPGFGTVRHYPGGFVLAEAASWLQRWMAAAGLDQAHLVGHSLGGYLCLRLAVARPQVVKRLVLVAPAGVPLERSWLGHVVALLRGAVCTTPGDLGRAAYDAWQAGLITLWRVLRDLLAADVRRDLAAVAAPTLLVWGERDTVIPLSAGLTMRASIPCARLVVLPGAGHVPMIDRPGPFAAVVLAFLASQPAGGPNMAGATRAGGYGPPLAPGLLAGGLEDIGG